MKKFLSCMLVISMSAALVAAAEEIAGMAMGTVAVRTAAAVQTAVL